MIDYARDISALIRTALNEDIPKGDITSETVIPADKKGSGYVVSRRRYVVSGIEVAKLVYSTLDKDIEFSSQYNDGDIIEKGETLFNVSGNVLSILKAERIVLNIIGQMMGVATKTRGFVELIKDTSAVILDTRKTIPGMRALQRLAVRHGGASNHRYSLSDAVLIKENHILMGGGIKKVLAKFNHLRDVKIEIEVRNLDELEEVLQSEVKPDIIMLDNMSVDMVKKAVRINRGRVKLEVSGGINEKNIKGYAGSGVDFISLGVLTHSVDAADLSFLFS